MTCTTSWRTPWWRSTCRPASGAHLLDRDPEQARRTLAGHQEGQRRGAHRPPGHPRHVAVPRGRASHRAGAADAGARTSSRSSAPSLRSAGIEVELDIDPATSTVPAAVAATGYRIVQEALTNVVRHAHGARARVRVAREDERVVIDVTDDGRGAVPVGAPAPDGSGHGVRGMRERAEAAGGTLEAGPRPEGGWHVRATLPVAVPVTIRVLVADDQTLVRAGLPRAARLRGRHRGGRRGRRRCGRGRPGTRDPARRRAHGHPDAQARRPGGHRPDRGGPRPVRHEGARAHHLRAGRVRVRRAPGGRVGLPPQGRRPGGTDRRRTPRRRRPGSARAGRDPPADRGLRRGLTQRPAGRVGGDAHRGATAARAHPAGARGPHPGRARHDQPRDRRAPGAVPAHRQDPRVATLHQARRARPRPARRASPTRPGWSAARCYGVGAKSARGRTPATRAGPSRARPGRSPCGC